MRYVVPAVLFLVGALHLAPSIGMIGPERLAALYGIDVAEPNLEILMRHRAVLLGLLGAFLLYASWHRELHRLALIAASLAVVSFLALAWSIGGYNQAVSKVALADAIALALLVLGSVVHVIESGRHGR